MKTLFTSKTIWFGILQIVFGAVGMSLGFIGQDLGMGLIVTGFGSIGLRIKTTQPIE